MPYKRRNYKRRKRPYKKRYKKRSIYAPGRKPPLGTKLKAQFRYVDTDLSINPPLGGLLGEYVFSCNGLYDPDITGTGHQPMPFDDMMSLYDHYTVIGSRIRVDFHNSDTTNPVICGIYLRDTSTSPSDPRNVLENGMSKWKLLAPKGSGGDTKSMTLDFSTKKHLGVSHPLASSEVRGNLTSNPAEGYFYHIFCCTPDGGDGAEVDFVVTIEYIAVLTEPKLTGIS